MTPSPTLPLFQKSVVLPTADVGGGMRCVTELGIGGDGVLGRFGLISVSVGVLLVDGVSVVV